MELFEDIEHGENACFTTLASANPLQKKDMQKYLGALTVEHLKAFHRFLFRAMPALVKKTELIQTISTRLNFSAESQFREWFFALPALIQIIFYRGAFTDYLLIPVLERELGISLVEKKSRYWRPEWMFKPELNLDLSFLPVQVNYDCPVIVIPTFLRKLLCVWLAPPASSQLPECRIAEQTESYDNSSLIPDTLPLLCDAIHTILETAGLKKDDMEKFVRAGFKKKDINELRSSSGFLPFKMDGEHAPSSVDLAARFVLCMHDHKPRRPGDGQEGVRALVHAFFGEKTQYPHARWYTPDRAYLEYNICIDHLGRTSGYYMEKGDQLPPSRKVFHDILLHMVKDGGWFDTDALADYIRATGEDFSFCDRSLEKSFKLKADTFEFEGLTLDGYYDEFRPDGILRHCLLVRPLFKVYCYIFAALGILEITQAVPPLVRKHRNKHLPFSPYDSLKAVRVTELGRWCLGASSKPPERPAQEYQAIADKELLLVTVQGNSLERRVYLDKIGKRLGEDRWRISPGSFIAGCVSKRQIAERIERFKSLIDPTPALHWEKLFRMGVERAGLFDARRTDLLIFDLPQDREIQEELLGDPEIRRIVRRVEGRMLAIAAKNQLKFFALLGEHGIAHF